MKAIALALLLLSPIAHAQIQYGTAYSGAVCANPKNLDGAVLDQGGRFCVVHTGCKVPETLLLNREAPVDNLNNASEWTEKTAPCDWQGGEGNLVSFPAGVNFLKVAGSTVRATFTVTGTAPTPPVPTAGTQITWTLPTQNEDGSALTNLLGIRVYVADGTKVAELGKVTSWTPTVAGTYYVTAFTSSAESKASASVAFAGPPAPPPTCSATPPPVESRQMTCTPPTVGMWTQTHGWTSIAAPACWQEDAWLPTQPPVGQCAAPSPLLTAGPLSYSPGGTATAPTMTAIGLIAAGLPCGPDTKTVANVKYCRIVRAQTDFVNWPTDLKAVDIWAKSQ
jgi:hypothetical protein